MTSWEVLVLYLEIFCCLHVFLLCLYCFTLGAGRGGKKNPNPLAHPNPPTNYPPKPTYLINGQMGASPIRPN